MTTREEILAEIEAEEKLDREVLAYEEACDEGFEGTFSDFHRVVEEERGREVRRPIVAILSDADDISF